MKKNNYTKILGGLFTLALVFFFSAGYGQMAVKSDGKIVVGNNSATPTANLDIPMHSTSNNVFQAGSFGIQSTNDINGFLTSNCFYNGTGGQMTMRNTGAGFMMQFAQGRLLFRPVPTANSGASSPSNTAMVIHNDKKVSINLSHTIAPTEALQVNGNILADNVSVPSDKRLKKNIKSFKGGLEEVLQMNPISFQYNGEAGISNTKDSHIGLIAQEVQNVAPYLVRDHKFIQYEDHSFDGEIVRPKKIVKSADYLKLRDSEIKFLLINAVKEQQEIIESQAESIENLQLKLEEIYTLLEGKNSDINVRNETLIGVGSIEQNKPNPFNRFTKIDYNVPSNVQNASIAIFDMSGKLIKNVKIDSGEGVLELEVIGLKSGHYTYSLMLDGQVQDTRKMVIAE